MSWKSICFGSEHPSVLRVVVVSAFMAGLTLCFYGMIFADFIPSDDWYSFGYYSSVGVATVLTLWMYWAHLTGRLQSPERRRWVRILSFLALPFLFFGYCYLCLMYALPDLGTRWLGEKAARTEVATTRVREGRGHTFGSRLARRFCRYYIEGPGVDRAFLSRICSATPIPDNSPSPSALDLNGSRSWFGFHVSAIVRRPVEPENDAPSVAAGDLGANTSPDRQEEPLPSAATENRGTIDVERTGSNSYRLHLTGADLDSAAAGLILLTPKAAELCGSEPYRFGHSLYSWKQSMARGGEPEAPIVELTQDVHCGISEAVAAEARRIGLADLPEKTVIAASEEYLSLRESGRYEGAYEFFDASRNSVPPFAEWQERVSNFHTMAGALDYRRVRTIDWYGTAPDEVYVALDFVGRYANAIAHCAHLVWHWQPDRSFVLVSEEELYKHQERERLFEDHCAEGTW